MKLTVTGRHLVVSEAARAAITAKIGRLTRVLNSNAVSAQCVLARERQQVLCELTVHVRGDHILHGVGRDRLLPAAVAGAVEKVLQQALRLTDRWKTRRRDGSKRTADRSGVAEPDTAAPTPRLIRARGQAVKPMTVDDAVLALTASTQTFLVFRIAPTGEVAVVYRRPDGHFGLIEPGE